MACGEFSRKNLGGAISCLSHNIRCKLVDEKVLTGIYAAYDFYCKMPEQRCVNFEITRTRLSENPPALEGAGPWCDMQYRAQNEFFDIYRVSNGKYKSITLNFTAV